MDLLSSSRSFFNRKNESLAKKMLSLYNVYLHYEKGKILFFGRRSKLKINVVILNCSNENKFKSKHELFDYFSEPCFNISIHKSNADKQLDWPMVKMIIEKGKIILVK